MKRGIVHSSWSVFVCAFIALVSPLAACGDDGTEADRFGVGAQCGGSADCDQETDQECLSEFAGGYCGIRDCAGDADCLEGSGCVAHDNGTNYCFRICRDKLECNRNRDVDVESNCSSNVDFTDGDKGRKACVPPSSGT